MSAKVASCIDCRCKEVSHNIKRDGGQLISIETTFSCGARKREFTDTPGRIDRVEYEGCSCAA
jgi:hypothetical protein